MIEQMEIVSGCSANLDERLRDVSGLLGDIANRIEVADDLGEINESTRRALGIISSRLVAQVEFIDGQLRGVGAEHQIEDNEGVARDNPPEVHAGSNGHNSVGSKPTAIFDPTPSSDTGVEDEVPGGSNGSKKEFYVGGTLVDVEDFLETQRPAIERLLEIPGKKFRPADLKRLLESETDMGKDRMFLKMLKAIKSHPVLGDKLRSSGETKARRYWIDGGLREDTDSAASDSKTPINTVEDDQPMALTTWGLEISPDGKELSINGQKIDFREDAVAVIKILAAQRRGVTLVDLYKHLEDIGYEADERRLNGIIHEIENRLRDNKVGDWWSDKYQKIDGELCRVIEINGVVEEDALPDFLAQEQ